MKTKTKRYEQVAHQKETTRDQIIRCAGITEQAYYELEMETGIALLENYFYKMDPGIVYHLRRQLLHRRIHGYWTWCINQKQQCEFAFHTEYTAAVGDATDTEHYKSEYLYALRAFIANRKTHDRLRQFILQSTTLSA